MSEGETLVNAVIGAVVGVVAGMVAPPMGPLIGGMVAGYLQAGDRTDGLRVGTVVGLLTSLPLLMFLFAVWAFLGAFGIGIGMGMAGGPWALFAGGFGLVATLAMLGFVLYFVVTGAVGGWLGNYITQDTEIDI